jgi:LmbE family N-acetylglucosaminyl deacetylase
MDTSTTGYPVGKVIADHTAVTGAGYGRIRRSGAVTNMEHTKALVAVAHPDDEVLWAGGTILTHAHWEWTVVCLCRASDPDRAPRFFRVAERLGARAFIGDLDDGPDQTPLEGELVETVLGALLPREEWDIVFTHGPRGEYTRHRRHEEVSRAVAALWLRGDIVAPVLRLFAYEDGGRRYHPRAVAGATVSLPLDESVWQAKRDVMERLYGFAADSWEVQTTPRVEAFWEFRGTGAYQEWLKTHRIGPVESDT